MEIKYVIFDFGGVLLSEDDAWLHSDDVKNLLKVDDSKLTEAWDTAWPESRNGHDNENQFFSKFLHTATGESDTQKIMQLKQIYRKYVDKGEAYQILPKLTGKYHLYALTNIAKDWLEFKVKYFNLSEYLEVIISSCNEGIGKPYKEIYESLIKKTNLTPENALFIDNSERNLIPARDLGFNTILYKNYEEMLAEMKNMGMDL